MAVLQILLWSVFLGILWFNSVVGDDVDPTSVPFTTLSNLEDPTTNHTIVENLPLETDQLTHVPTKFLSGHIELSTLQVLTTTPPVQVSANPENPTAEINAFTLSTIMDYGSLADAPQEAARLMDVFNGTSGTWPDQTTTTEKLFIVTPLKLEPIDDGLGQTERVEVITGVSGGLAEEFTEGYHKQTDVTDTSEDINLKSSGEDQEKPLISDIDFTTIPATKEGYFFATATEEQLTTLAEDSLNIIDEITSELPIKENISNEDENYTTEQNLLQSTTATAADDNEEIITEVVSIQTTLEHNPEDDGVIILNQSAKEEEQEQENRIQDTDKETTTASPLMNKIEKIEITTILGTSTDNILQSTTEIISSNNNYETTSEPSKEEIMEVPVSTEEEKESIDITTDPIEHLIPSTTTQEEGTLTIEQNPEEEKESSTLNVEIDKDVSSDSPLFSNFEEIMTIPSTTKERSSQSSERDIEEVFSTESAKFEDDAIKISEERDKDEETTIVAMKTEEDLVMSTTTLAEGLVSPHNNEGIVPEAVIPNSGWSTLEHNPEDDGVLIMNQSTEEEDNITFHTPEETVTDLSITTDVASGSPLFSSIEEIMTIPSTTQENLLSTRMDDNYEKASQSSEKEIEEVVTTESTKLEDDAIKISEEHDKDEDSTQVSMKTEENLVMSTTTLTEELISPHNHEGIIPEAVVTNSGWSTLEHNPEDDGILIMNQSDPEEEDNITINTPQEVVTDLPITSEESTTLIKEEINNEELVQTVPNYRSSKSRKEDFEVYTVIPDIERRPLSSLNLVRNDEDNFMSDINMEEDIDNIANLDAESFDDMGAIMGVPEDQNEIRDLSTIFEDNEPEFQKENDQYLGSEKVDVFNKMFASVTEPEEEITTKTDKIATTSYHDDGFDKEEVETTTSLEITAMSSDNEINIEDDNLVVNTRSEFPTEIVPGITTIFYSFETDQEKITTSTKENLEIEVVEDIVTSTIIPSYEIKSSASNGDDTEQIETTTSMKESLDIVEFPHEVITTKTEEIPTTTSYNEPKSSSSNHFHVDETETTTSTEERSKLPLEIVEEISTETTSSYYVIKSTSSLYSEEVETTTSIESNKEIANTELETEEITIKTEDILVTSPPLVIKLISSTTAQVQEVESTTAWKEEVSTTTLITPITFVNNEEETTIHPSYSIGTTAISESHDDQTISNNIVIPQEENTTINEDSEKSIEQNQTERNVEMEEIEAIPVEEVTTLNTISSSDSQDSEDVKNNEVIDDSNEKNISTIEEHEEIAIFDNLDKEEASTIFNNPPKEVSSTEQIQEITTEVVEVSPEEDPQVCGTLSEEKFCFSIKIKTNDSTFFVPQDALFIPSPNAGLRITWRSSISQNNSLLVNLEDFGNSAQLNMVEGNRIHAYKTQPHPENKLGSVDRTVITLEEGAQVEFSNIDFVTHHQKETRPEGSLPATHQDSALAAEIMGGCIGFSVIIGVVLYYTIRKFRAKTRNFKPNSVA